MKRTTKIITGIIFILGLLQFFRIEKNHTSDEQVNAISKHFNMPDEVQSILKTACFDCHSNNTIYPWYANVQPVAWWLQGHVNEGKEELNFDEFASYKPRRQFKKLEEAIEMVKEGEMPLSSYTLAHADAKLSQAQKETLVAWCDGVMQEIKVKNPGSAPVKEEREEEKD